MKWLNMRDLWRWRHACREWFGEPVRCSDRRKRGSRWFSRSISHTRSTLLWQSMRWWFLPGVSTRVSTIGWAWHSSRADRIHPRATNPIQVDSRCIILELSQMSPLFFHNPNQMVNSLSLLFYSLTAICFKSSSFNVISCCCYCIWSCSYSRQMSRLR